MNFTGVPTGMIDYWRFTEEEGLINKLQWWLYQMIHIGYFARQLPIVYRVVSTKWLILIVEFENLFIIPAIVYHDTVNPCTSYLNCLDGIL